MKKSKVKRFLSWFLAFCLGFLSVLNGGNLVYAETKEEKVVVREQEFNEGWRFQLENNITGEPWQKEYDEESWENVTLPHDWSIFFDFKSNSPANNEGGLLNGGIGWYRKTFILPSEVNGKTIRINFGGVYMDSTVFVNGEEVGNYPSGYTPFSYNITSYVKTDGSENTIAVKVVNKQPSSRWYSGSGIYRDVTLSILHPVHVAPYGTTIITPNLKEEKNGDVTTFVETIVTNKSDEEKAFKVRLTPLTAEGKEVGTPLESEEVIIASNESKTVDGQVIVNKPILWDTHQPITYRLRTDILIDNEVVDTTLTRYGYRYIDWSANEGFWLNGRNIKLHGVSMHHDQGALGAVANYAAMYRQLKIMKDMGVNAIRSTHNPADEKYIEICEDLGLLLIDEAFDTWYGGKKTYDYGRFFKVPATHPEATNGQTWAEFDLKAMVNRGKNSPAMIMWSLGNEIGESNSGGTDAVNTIKNLVKWTKEADPTRKTTMGQDVYRWAATGGHERISAEVDVVGLNYAEDNYLNIRNNHRDWIIYGSETSSATRSRGVYYRPDKELSHNKGSDRNYQQSDYGNDRVGWGKTATNAWIPDRNNQGYAGQFIWTGFDYIGEPTPWHNEPYTPPKSSYFGIVDTAGFPKNDYYFYQSQWFSVDEHPMVHILPHWNWEDENIAKDVKVEGKIPVRAFSNGASVELFLNGESQGKKDFVQKETNYGQKYQEGANPNELYLEWLVEFNDNTKGTLEAVAYNQKGEKIASDIIKTAGEPVAVQLKPEKRVIAADGKDLAYIEVNVTDTSGVEHPTADHDIQFTIEGDGEIVGVDNGNSASRERYKAQHDGTWKRKLFSGKALVIVQSTKKTGQFTLKARGTNLKTDTVTIFTQPKENLGQEIIVGYEVKPTITRVGVQPELAETVTGFYADSTTKELSVQWKPYDLEALNEIGSLKVEGTVVDTNDTVYQDVYVKGVTGIKETRLVTIEKTSPEFPGQVTAVYSDGSQEKVNVEWEKLDPNELVEGAQVQVKGTVSSLNMPTVAYVRVITANVIYDVEIGNKKQGNDYPKAYATFEAGDKKENINDGIIESSNRWTNWKNWVAANKTDSVWLEFQKAKIVGKVGIHFFTDSGTKEPGEVVIETSMDGQDWKAVTNQSQKSNFGVSTGDVATEYSIQFDPVEMKYIKLVMTAQPKDVDSYKPVGITEWKIYGAGEAIITPETLAELSEIKIDGKDLEVFSSQTKNYVVNLPYSTNLPVVTAKAAHHGSVFVLPVVNEEEVRLLVTSEDGKTEATYVIKWNMAEPILKEVKLGLDNTMKDNITLVEDGETQIKIEAILENEVKLPLDKIEVEYQLEQENEVKDGKFLALYPGTEKLTAKVTYKGVTIISEPINISITPNTELKEITQLEEVIIGTGINQNPELPTKIMATFDKGLPKEVNVIWDEIDSDQLKEFGSFVVEGKVEGTVIKAKATVTVKGFIAAKTVSLMTPLNEVPALPEKVVVYDYLGNKSSKSVTWEEVTEEMVVQIKTFTIEGLVSDTSLKAQLNLRVSNDTILGDNIAKQWTGSQLPAGIASFTNDGAGSKDKIELINDAIISYNSVPANRWTNWQRTSRDGDWVGILFAKGGDLEAQYVDNIQVAFFEDSGTSSPESYKVEYYVPVEAPSVPENFAHMQNTDNPLADDENWKEVSNLKADEYLEAGEKEILTFDKVKTYAIRINMKRKRDLNGLAITEFEVYEKKIQPNDNFSLDIQVDNVKLEDFTPEIKEYTYIYDGDSYPVVTATADNNGAVTIIPANNKKPKATIKVVSEGGQENVYDIFFERKLDTKELVNLIKNIEDMDLSNKTEESKHSLNQVLVMGRNLLDKSDLTQVEITDAIKVIKLAIDQLVDKSNGGSSYPSGSSSKKTSNEQDNKVKGKTDEGTFNIGIKKVKNNNGKKEISIIVDEDLLKKQVNKEKDGSRMSISVKDKTDSFKMRLTGQSIKDMQEKHLILEVETKNEDYNLLTNLIDLKEISDAIGEDLPLHNISLIVEISKPDENMVKVVESSAKTNELSIVLPPVNFEVQAVYKNKTYNVNKFKGFVSRTIKIPSNIDPNKITTAIVIEEDGKIRHVPTYVNKINGEYYATINSVTNSTYTLVYKHKSFSDVLDNHWAKTDIEKMASRLVVEGKEDGTFSPDEAITRAEFAEVLVKALGLKPVEIDKFMDVEKGTKVAGYIGIAYNYGIIKGVSETSFNPKGLVTRQDAMTMIYSAGLIANLQDKENTKDMIQYTDYNKVSDYAKRAVEWNIDMGIIIGKTSTSLAPYDNITRAEISAVSNRLLQKAGYIE